MFAFVRTSAIAVLLAAVFSAFACAQPVGQRDVVGVAYGSTAETATHAAYIAAFDSRLILVAGDQANASVGAYFHRQSDRDFEQFRSRYFSADTSERCVPEGERQLCEISGLFNESALRVDLSTVMASTRNGGSYTFIASAAEASDSRVSFVIDRLTGEFAAYNHRILFGGASTAAIRNGGADFSLALYAAEFSTFDFDPYLGRSNGALTVRFRLLDLAGSEVLAAVPVTVSASVNGSNQDANSSLLVEALADRAATEIARVVNSEVTAFADRASSQATAAELRSSGASTLRLRVIGADRRDAGDREQLAMIREILSSQMHFSQVQTDYDASSDTDTVISFVAGDGLVPDELIDSFYQAFGHIDGFYADYFGGQEYEVRIP